MSIKLITFDLDDTLWDTAPVIATAEVVLRDWLEANAPTLGSVPVEHLFAIRERLVQAEPGLKHRISALRRRVLFHALEEVGYSEQHAQALANEGFEVFLHARHQVEIFPEVQPVLEILRHQYILGVVTNGNADVSRLGLADYFRFALCAEDLGIGKPDPAPFLEALRRGEVDAGAAVHIGDHPGDDIAGAQRAGLRAVWFNPQGKAWLAIRRRTPRSSACRNYLTCLHAGADGAALRPIRGHAPSHRDRAGPEPVVNLWERACPRRGRHGQHKTHRRKKKPAATAGFFCDQPLR